MQLLSRDKYEDRLRTRAAFHVSDTECLFGSLTGISHRTRHVHLPPRAVFQRPLATVPSIHWPSSRTRYCPFFVSQSTSSTLRPSATEQQGPLRLARLSNHCLKGEFAYFPSRSRVRAKPGKNDNDNAIEKKNAANASKPLFRHMHHPIFDAPALRRTDFWSTCARNRVGPRSSSVPSSNFAWVFCGVETMSAFTPIAGIRYGERRVR
jgi:hypothetical protein